MLGRKTIEVEILKEAVELGREKKTHLARILAGRGGFPVKTIASSLGVARSHLVKQLAEPKANRPAAYLKTEDQFLLAKIEKICGHRPSYGYRRVCALINRERAFALDTCDREVISYVAKAGAMTGADIRDLIAQSVEARFGFAAKPPKPV